VTAISITAGPYSFEAAFERDRAPRTCSWFAEHLPFESKIIHVRWSGEAAWIPLGDLTSGVPLENHTTYPSRGDILFYPGGISEAEILFPYGSTAFASKVGPLAGNHFLTITSGAERLGDLGRSVLWEGALDIVFRSMD